MTPFPRFLKSKAPSHFTDATCVAHATQIINDCKEIQILRRLPKPSKCWVVLTDAKIKLLLRNAQWLLSFYGLFLGECTFNLYIKGDATGFPVYEQVA